MAIDIKTPLSYYGGKQTLAKEISSYFNDHQNYLEPFAGGAAVLFEKAESKRETLNDLDESIMVFWKCLRDEPDKLAWLISTTPYSREEWRKAKENLSNSDLDKARDLLIEVDQSFSRSRRSWSTPYIGKGGRWQPVTWKNLPEKILFAAVRLNTVCLECSDAIKLIPRWDRSGTVIYCDPPYTGKFRSHEGIGYKYENPKMWDALIETLSSITNAQVILSGYPCEDIDKLGWKCIPLNHRKRSQSRLGETIHNSEECIWINQ